MMRRLPFGLLAFLSIGVGLVAPMLWLLGLVEPSANLPPLVDHLLERYTVAQLLFLVHVVGGGLALLSGPWQLMPRLRARRPRLHRATGYIYTTVVVVGGSAGLLMSLRAWGGTVAQLGFLALAIGWLATTAIGLHRILTGSRAEHRAWMMRSYALAFAAVSLRLQFPILHALGVPYAIAYATVAWSSWVPNLVVVQLVLALARRNSAGEVPVQRRNARVNELCSENPSR